MEKNMQENWNRTESIKPQQNTKVQWMDSSGNVTEGTYSGRMWFMKDSSMYIYYEPVFWKYVK